MFFHCMEMSPEKGAAEVCFPHARMRVPKFLFPLGWIRTASSNDASLQSERAITVVKKRILFLYIHPTSFPASRARNHPKHGRARSTIETETD
jgi:hypothetical protein